MKINEHKPVLLEEAISSLNIRKNLHYVDATFGFGGYTKKDGQYFNDLHACCNELHVVYK